jgi:hypothetical protein
MGRGAKGIYRNLGWYSREGKESMGSVSALRQYVNFKFDGRTTSPLKFQYAKCDVPGKPSTQSPSKAPPSFA